MSRRKQEARALAANGKGPRKFHLVFNLKMERSQELRDWQRRTQRQKGDGRGGAKGQRQKNRKSETTEILRGKGRTSRDDLKRKVRHKERDSISQ